jgi:hypothetical protein
MTPILGLLLFTPSLLSAEIVMPVQATMTTRHYRIAKDGSKALIEEQRGVFLRRSDGSELRRQESFRNGAATGRAIAFIQDMAGRHVYRVDHHLKQIVVEGEIPPGFSNRLSQRNPPRPERILGEEVISGITCQVIAGPKNRERHNVACISFENDLVVKGEVEGITPDGTKLYVETMLSDIRLGVEPDVAEFQLPSGYRKLARVDVPSQCAACDRK